MRKNTDEGFKPIKHEPPTGFIGTIKYFGRMLLDLQILTIHTEIKKELPKFEGVILDVGCGQSPYKYLLGPKTNYKGIDIAEASDFNYQNKNITPFDGENIPFEDNTFNGLICTEVLEHVYNHQILVNEMFRVCKAGARGIITVPFSARYHYIPHDYFRYTPSALTKIFSKFSRVEITPRGTDILSICSKVIVLFARNLVPNSFLTVICWPLWISLLPILGITVFIAHISRIFKLGSTHDPLGYTIKITK